MTEDIGASSPPANKTSFISFIKQQLKQRPHRDDDDSSSAFSTSPTSSTSPFFHHQSLAPSSHHQHGHHHSHGSRPKLPHMSHSSSAVNTVRKPSPSMYVDPYAASFTDNIFGVPLAESVKYASGSIKLGKKLDKNGNPIILGKIPVIVANCAHFLKTSNAKKVEGIFRVSGSARRIKELQAILTDPNQDYGKNIDWSLYTVHDAANILRRYLNNLPEPIIPLEFYEKFRAPLLSFPTILEHLQGGNAISATTPPPSAAISPSMKGSEASDLPSVPLLQVLDTSANPPTDQDAANTAPESPKVDPAQLKRETEQAIQQYKKLVDQLPILNQQVFLYILDLLYFFAQNSKENLMPAVNLASIFQPSLLSHPEHDMIPKEYHLSRAVVQFLIENFTKLMPSIQSWITYGSSLGADVSATRTPSSSSYNLAVPPQRRHSKSMSSVTVPSSIQSYIKEPIKSVEPPSEKPELTVKRVRPSTAQPAKESGISEVIHALKRGASLSRRRTSSTSTASSTQIEPTDTSNTSLSRQNTLSKGQTAEETGNSEETEPKSPTKSPSSVTITPKRKPVAQVSATKPVKAEITRVPVLKTTDENGSSKDVSSSDIVQDSEANGPDSEGDKGDDKYKVKRKSVATAPAIGQLSFVKAGDSRSSLGFGLDTAMSIDSALASPVASIPTTVGTSSTENQLSQSPKTRGGSLGFLKTVPTNTSESSFNPGDSDEETGYFRRPSGASISSATGSPPVASSPGPERRRSRWRRSIIGGLGLGGGSDSSAFSPPRSPGPMSPSPGPTSPIREQSVDSLGGKAESTGRSFLRKIGHRRDHSRASVKSTATEEGMSDSALSNN